MRFILTGFTQTSGVRIFNFEGVGTDQSRTGFAVHTDLALSRRHGIQLQELPLLCQAILERRQESDQAGAVTFSEADMMVHANSCALEREARKKKQSTHKSGAAPADATSAPVANGANVDSLGAK